MRILVLGGTRFAGRAIVDAALGRGDTVTTFNRGRTAPGLYPGVETVTGDRTVDLSPLDGREFDAVIDVACYDPQVARLAAEAFRDRTGRYVFVSTVSVYADQSTTEAQLEDAPLARLKPDVTDPLENYGANKALAEAVIREVFPGRALIGRPGLITGPHDPTDRFPYWPRRIAAGGQVLAPGDPVDAELTWISSDRLVAAGVDPGGGHTAVGRRAWLRGVQRRGLLPRRRCRPQLPADHRDDPRHPLLGPGPRRPGGMGPVSRAGDPPARRAGGVGNCPHT